MENSADNNAVDKQRRRMAIVWGLNKAIVLTIGYIMWFACLVACIQGLRLYLSGADLGSYCEPCNGSWKLYIVRFAAVAVFSAVWVTPQYYAHKKLKEAVDPATGNDKANRLMLIWIRIQLVFMVLEVIIAEYLMMISSVRDGCYVWVGRIDCRCWIVAVLCLASAIKRGLDVWIGIKYQDALEKDPGPVAAGSGVA